MNKSDASENVRPSSVTKLWQTLATTQLQSATDENNFDLDRVYTYVIITNKMHNFTLMFQFNCSVFDMFRTSKYSSSGSVVHAVVRYFHNASV